MSLRAPSFEKICGSFVDAGHGPQDQDCIPSQTLCAAAAGELTPEQMEALVLHCSLCPACAEDWRIARAFTSASRPVFDSPPQEESSSGEVDSNLLSFGLYRRARKTKYEMHGGSQMPSQSSWRSLAIAASFVAIGWYGSSKLDWPEGGAHDETTIRGTLVAESGYEFDGQHFRWPDFAPGSRYSVLVYLDGFKETVLAENLKDTSWTADTSANKVFARKPKVWRVKAMSPEGILRVSPPQPFRIAK